MKLRIIIALVYLSLLIHYHDPVLWVVSDIVEVTSTFFFPVLAVIAIVIPILAICFWPFISILIRIG